jgi:hypothetical protein
MRGLKYRDLVLTLSAAASPTAALAQSGAVVPPKSLALIGVTQIGDKTEAWLVDLSSRRREIAGQGGSAFGYRVKQIGQDRVILTRGTQQVVLRLGDKPVPGAQARPALADVPIIRPSDLPVPGQGTPPGIEQQVPQRDVETVLPTQPPAPEPQPRPVMEEPYYPAYPYPYYPFNPYAEYGYPYGLQPGYPEAYAPWVGPTGAYPYGAMGPYRGSYTAPPMRWNPQTSRRRSADPLTGIGSTNPQTRRRREGTRYLR